MKRRDFLIGAGVATATALTTTGCNSENGEKKNVNINKNRKVRLKLATSWPAHFPIMGTGVDEFAKIVKEASSGSLQIKVYAKNTLIPALAVFDATSTGQIDIFHSGPYYWKGKNSAFSLFSGTPFGFTAEEINAWMMFGGGLELWRELYAKYNLYPFVGGNTNVQMGGWFRKPIESVEDLKGLKMRVPGLGGELFAKLGVNPILLPAGEIYTALERGTIDATEWVGPALDLKMGFYKVAKYYYSGWHEPGSILELTFNKRSFEKLSNEHKAIIQMASERMNSRMTYEFLHENAKALATFKDYDIEMRRFPEAVETAAKKAFDQVISQQSEKSADFAKVYGAIEHYLNQAKPWADIGLKSYFNSRG
jgi:TRAP-type mannitol/chloroaromatic compound transport system substrate-binding protein